MSSYPVELMSDHVMNKLDTVHIVLDFNGDKTDYKLFFDMLNKNTRVIELVIDGFNNSYKTRYNFDISGFVENFRLPSNITKLNLPCLNNIKEKSLVIPPNIEKLTLERLCDIEGINFAESTKLKYVRILEGTINYDPYPSKEIKLDMPTSVVKIYMYTVRHKMTIPPNIKKLKLGCFIDLNNVIFMENIELEEIDISDEHEYYYKHVIKHCRTHDLSHVYNLKTIKIKTQFPNIYTDKIKLPYGAIVEFYKDPPICRKK